MLVYLILHYKNADVTENCIEALLRTMLEDAEIVVVDNASNNGSYERLTEKYQKCTCIHFIKNESNLGYAAGNNVGFRYAKNELKADWIVLLNNDVIVEQERFQQILLSEYEKEPFYIAGPDIITPEGNSQNPYLMTCPTKKEIIKKLFHDYVVLFLMKIRVQQLLKKILHYDGSIFQHNELPSIRNFEGTLHGSCIIFSPDYINKFNGLYGGTFLYCEEEILCYILQRLDYSYCYLKTLQVIHHHSVSMKREVRDDDKRKMLEISRRIQSYKKFLHIIKEKNDIGRFLV